MTELELLLEYQAVDGKLRAIEQEINASDERKKFVSAKKFLEKAPEKLDALDNKALSCRRSAEQLTKRYIELVEGLKEYSNLDELVEGGGDISFYEKSVQAVSDSLKAIKSEIAALENAITAAQKEYASLKQQTISAQKQFKEYKIKYNEVKDSRAEEMKKLEAELSQIEKDIQPALMDRYKAKRRERIFPIVGEMTGDRCPFCGMDFPIALQSKLSGGHAIECENCHRLIYKK